MQAMQVQFKLTQASASIVIMLNLLSCLGMSSQSFEPHLMSLICQSFTA
jgi:hypothetical protein